MTESPQDYGLPTDHGEWRPHQKREWRKAHGLCTVCGQQARPNRTLCQRCADKNYERVKRWWAKKNYGKTRYARDKTKGVCLGCGKPHVLPPNLCLDCQQKYKDYHKGYYQNNWETHNKKVAVWQSRNPERVHRYKAKYRNAHKKEMLEYQKWWCKQNPLRAVARTARHRCKKANAKGSCTSKQIQQRIDYYGGLCYLCGKPYEEIGHVIPLVVNPLGWAANLRPVCRSCNASKGGKSLQQYLRAREDS